MEPRGLTRFNAILRLPLRHKKRRPLTQAAPDLGDEHPPSYSECSAYFYPPPSYEESVGDSAPTGGRKTAERRHSVNRMSWGSDTSASSSESSSSAYSASSATPISSSPTLSHISPTAPPLPLPNETSNSTSSHRERNSSESALSMWLASVSSTLSSPRSVENLPRQRHRCASPDSVVNTSSSSSSDVITRIQPRLRSWTQCMRWVIQYTLEGNFKSTLAHFRCLVNEGLRVCRRHEADTEAYPIRLASLPIPRPTALSLKTWIEFILCVGFKFSQSHLNNNNHNNNNNNNNNNSDDDDHQYNFLASILENSNNNNGNIGDEMGDLSVIVPRGLAPRRLMKHHDVLTGLLELPYNAIKTAANMSRTETERIIALLTPLIQSSPEILSPITNHALSLDHALVRSVWDVHRRPGFLLQSLGFTVSRRGGEAGGKCLRIPAGEAATRRLQLAKDILEMFLRT